MKRVLTETLSGPLVFLFYYAAASVVVPVLTLYYQEAGVSGQLLGVLAAIWPAGTVVGAAIWGAVADATGRHRLVLVVATLTAIGSAQLFLFATSFVTLAPIIVMFSLAMSPIIPVVDNAVLDSLGRERSKYGRVRLWGAVGWGVAAPLVGVLIDSLGLRVVFPVYGALMLLTLAVSFLLPVGTAHLRAEIRAGIRMMAADRRWGAFLLIVMIRGIGGAFILHFLFIYLAEIGGSGTLRGVALAIATVSELFVFFFAHRVLERFGPRRTILFALGATAIRLLLYAIVSNPYLALAVQLMHGLTFSLFLVAAVNYAKELAPEGMGATAQAAMTSTNIGAGGIIGALLGGVLYQRVGLTSMFLTASLFLFLACGLFAVFFGRSSESGARRAGDSTTGGRAPPTK